MLIQNMFQNRNWTTKSVGGIDPRATLFKGSNDNSLLNHGNFPLVSYMGYPRSASANYISLPMKYGLTRSRINAQGQIVADIEGFAGITVVIAGNTATLTATVGATATLAALINNSLGTITGTMNAEGVLTAVIRIGANPTAEQLSDAVWQKLMSQYENIDGSFGQHLGDALTRTDFVGLK